MPWPAINQPVNDLANAKARAQYIGPDARAIGRAPDKQSPAVVARSWAGRNHRFLEIIFERFDTDAYWPQLEQLQRALDRVGEEIDLFDIARSLPHELGAFEMSASRVTLKVRALAVVRAAGPLLDAVVRAVQLGVERYLDDEDRPRLSSRDLEHRLGLDPLTRRKVAQLLDGEMFIFAGGTGDIAGDSWEREVSRAIREFRAVNSLGGYLAAQAGLLWPVPTDLPGGREDQNVAIARVAQLRRRGSVAAGPMMPTARDEVTAADTGGDAGPAQPVLRLHDLHPVIRDACVSRFASRHYSDGVQQAAIALRDLVRKRGGRELRGLDGVDLMSQALSPKDPRLLVADVSTRTGQSVQLGSMLLAQGAIAALRNPVAHERLNLELPEAMEMVAALSLVARLVQQAKRPRRRASPPGGDPAAGTTGRTLAG